MIRRVTRRYVKGFLQAAVESDCVEPVEKTLKEFDRVFRENREISEIISHPTVPRGNKKRLLQGLLGDSSPELLKHFVDYVVDKKRERIFSFLYQEYKTAAAQLKGIVSAKVRSAIELSKQQSENITGLLEQKLNNKVELECEIDEKLIGGLQVFLGSYIIDGSVKGRLDKLHKKLLESAG
jgi:F-type H+-transporting ATPase subunit delta